MALAIEFMREIKYLLMSLSVLPYPIIDTPA